MGTQSNNLPRRVRLLFIAAWILLPAGARSQTADTPLLLPSGVSFDSLGNLYFAESSRHIVRRLSSAGVLTVVAGNSSQGFAGDGGPATAAALDSPAAVVVDASGDLFIADTHNHRIRRVDALTGTISSLVAQAGLPVALAVDSSGNLLFADAATHLVMRLTAGAGQATVIAGNGTQGFSGDGGAATNAALDSPSGLALDSAANLYIADAHNQRIRRVDAVTGIITTVAGSGMPGFYGDGGPSASARLSLPKGVTLDASGNLYIADSQNHRIRRIDGASGLISTVAGDGTQSFLGDGSAASGASLDSPRSVALTASGLVTLGDTNNGRVRQVDATAVIQTIAGVGAVSPSRLASTTVLTQTSAQMLSAVVTASSGTPTGSVTLMDGNMPISSASLSGGYAAFSIAGLSVGSHTLSAAYSGSGSFLPSISAPLLITVSPPAPADFTLASSGPTAMTVATGGSATFAFTVQPVGSTLSSAIALAASGLPPGATAAFAPAYLPPPSGPANFTLTITTPAASASVWRRGLPAAMAALLLLPLTLRRRRRRVIGLGLALLLCGCGDRTSAGAASGGAPLTYNINVSATATSASGAVLLHTAQVTLTVQ